MNNNGFLDYKELKSFDFSPWGGVDGFLAASRAGVNGQAAMLKRYVPDLSRAVDMIAVNVAGMPFDIVDNESGEIFDTSTEWQNLIGGMPNPQRTIYLLASSLCGGAAYIIPQRTSRLIVDLQYAAPHTIMPQIDSAGLQYFDRSSDAGVYERLTPDEVIYFWLPDSDVEIGAALNTPLSNATADAILSLNSKNTMGKYSARGFVPITALGAKGMPNPGEREKAERFFDRLLRSGFDVLAKIINSEALSIIKLGAGMDEMKGAYTEIMRQSKEDIAQAFGIPTALFMSDNAFASEFNALRRQFYTSSRFKSIYMTIEEAFTEQLFAQYGKSFYFRPESMDAFQEDETIRAGAMSQITAAILSAPEIAKWSMDVLGYDLTAEQEEELEEIISEKEQARTDMQAQTAPKQPQEAQGATPQDNMEDNAPEEVEDTAEPLTPDETKDLALWYTKAKAWNLKGKGNAVDWECKHLREEVAAPIRVRLADAKTELDIVKAFEIGKQTRTVTVSSDAAIKSLADAINKAAERVEVKEVAAPVYNMTMPAITLNAQMPANGSVTVNVPEQPAPIVNVKTETPQVTVNNTPAVNNVTVQPADVVIPAMPTEATITTDRNGKKTLKVKQ